MSGAAQRVAVEPLAPCTRRAQNLRVSPRLGILAVVLVLVTMPLAGCGGGEESAGEQWAGDVCGQLSTWVTEVEEAVTALSASTLSLDKAAVQAAVEDVHRATDELVDGLADLGPPDTDSGEEARSELDELGTELQQQLDQVEQAAEAGSLSLVAVTGALATAAAAVSSTFESLQSLDADEELRDGFESAGSCESFRQQVDTIGD
jgi:ABC-type Na+ efflux pump permease subunit